MNTSGFKALRTMRGSIEQQIFKRLKIALNFFFCIVKKVNFFKFILPYQNFERKMKSPF